MDEFTATYTEDADILALTEKIKVLEDPELTALVPNKRAARVEIRLKDGTVKMLQIDYPKGEPENPLSEADLEVKFYSLAQFGGKTAQQADEIIAVVRDVENSLEKMWALVI
jgi:2-methylcitrate dehydratase PrpD